MSENQYIIANSTKIQSNPNENVLIGILIPTLYVIIFFLGIIGNSIVVYFVCKNKTMRTVTNVFIANMALSDIIICLLSIPFTWITLHYEKWKFGSILCSLVPFSMGVSVYVSTLTSLAIAIDRYFVIVHPFKPRMKLSVTLITIVVIWILSISISLPLAVYQKFELNSDGTGECGVSKLI
jgi:neuropeptide F receptor